jgi:ribosomal protein S27AE
VSVNPVYPQWKELQKVADQKAAVGWQCPGCQGCYSPTVKACTNCGPSDPPFVNDHSTRIRQCTKCGFQVRPGYVHEECYAEGIPLAEWRNVGRGDCE